MLHDIIEKNERFLRFCSRVAHTVGFFLILITFLTIAFPLSAVLWAGSPKNIATNLLLTSFVIRFIRILFLIFLFLGIEQFIRCLIDIDFKPNWILRFGDKIIYMYAVFIFVTPIHAYTQMPELHNIPHSAVIALAAIFTFVKIILWVGFGLVLKRLVPIIQESKTII
jgi:hypothetical protein